MSAVTPQGFTRTRLDERFAQLRDAMVSIFGPEINLAPDSIDGQTLGIYAESIANLDQLAEDVYQGLNPQSATGLALSRLVQLNGIRRIPGAYATVTLRCTGSDGTTIPAGSLVGTTTVAALYQTSADASIGPSGVVDVAARSIDFGPNVAPAGTLTRISTPVYGWQTVTNLADAIPGRLEETDEALRVRRAKSTATPSVSILDGIYGAVSNLPGVRQAVAYENDQDVPDPVTGQAPHSIYVIADGGDNAAIAGVIFLKKTLGATLIGNTSVTVTDSQGFPHVVKFQRPDEIEIYITVNVETRPGWPGDGAARIASALVEWALLEQEIGEELTFSRLFTPINSVPGHSVTSLFIGTSASPTGTANIPVGFDEIARLDAARITVNVSTP